MDIIERLEPIPSGANPFDHDSHHMGVSFGLEERMVAMFDDKLKYVILIDRKSGKRLKIHLDWKRSQKIEEY